MILINSSQVMIAGDKDNIVKELAVAVAKFIDKVQSQEGTKFEDILEEFNEHVLYVNNMSEKEAHKYPFADAKKKKPKKKSKKKLKKIKDEHGKK